MSLKIRHPTSSDGPRLLELFKEAFSESETNWEEFVKREKYNYENAVVVCVGDNLATHAYSYDYDMYLRGKPIPVAGIAGVATFSEYRKRGFAKIAIEYLLKKAYTDRKGGAILYPFYTEFYRKLGWETTPMHFYIRLNPNGINLTMPPENIEFSTFTEEHIPEVNKVYTKIAKQKYSFIVRNESHWKRLLKKALSKVIIKENRKIVGYIFTRQGSVLLWEFPYSKRRVSIIEWVAETPNAVKSIFWYIKLFENTTKEVMLRLPNMHEIPVHLFLSDLDYALNSNNSLMGRIVFPEVLFSKMGWPENVSAKLTFQLKDDILQENTGLWTLEIDNGKLVSIEKDASAVKTVPVELDVRQLSGIIFGSYTLRTLHQYNMITVHSTNVNEILKKWDRIFPEWPGYALDYF